MQLTGIYKGFQVEYLSDTKTYRLLVNGEFEYKSNDLEKVKAYIDRMSAKKFPKVKAFYLKDDYSPVLVEITGISQDEGIWISEKESTSLGSKNKLRVKRQKYFGTLFLDQPENHELLRLVKERDGIVRQINSEKRDLLNRMITYVVKDSEEI